MSKVRITEEIEDYIRKAYKSGEKQKDIARILGVSHGTVNKHINGDAKIRRCKECGVLIKNGSYCSSTRCRKISNRITTKKWSSKNKNRVKRKNSRYRLEHVKANTYFSGKKVELTCEVCGKPFLRTVSAVNEAEKRNYKRNYCSRECCNNRGLIKKLIERKIKNIEILSKLIDKEKTIETDTTSKEMSQRPEHEEHMKK
jgi:hypothetical protein